MRKKIFCPNFAPAELVKGADRWYIRFYQLEKGKQIRYRITFNLNRITNLREREQRASALIQKINWWLASGKPAKKFNEEAVDRHLAEEAEVNHLEATNIIAAVQLALDIKGTKVRPASVRTYNSVGSLFLDYLRLKHMDDFTIGNFGKKHAVAYLDYCSVKRKVGATTYNNTIQHLRSIFSELVAREYIKSCPWKLVDYKKKVPPKKRRNFTPAEAKIVLTEIKQVNPTLFLAILIQYTCFLRPSEIRTLRFKDINTKDWSIFLSYDNSKDWTDRYVTIPKAFQQYFDLDFLAKGNPLHYIFGPGLQPHANLMCFKHEMYNYHKRILHELKKRGALADITGLQFYSWKDTGITNALEQISIVGVQEQAGHSSPEITMKYRHKKRKNEMIDRWKDDLF